ncbi:phage portal protein [Vibrio fluvialis]|uniref:phage portal protein n=1 Tax=Vibrio fluvialis TaxID=676 RepID=UPI001EECDE73|nr:phage portal protein [Vibrio fluvialis]MCG6410413.1 phage portal protein [Vibrio fluvialis]
MFNFNKKSNVFTGLGFGGSYSASGIPVTYETALEDPTVKACIRVIAQTISTLPLVVEKRSGQRWERDFDSITANTLTRAPNVRQTSTEFIESLVAQMLLYSEAYALPKFAGKSLVSLMPFNSPLQVSVVEKNNSDHLLYTYSTNTGQTGNTDEKGLLILRDLSLTTYKALNKVNDARNSIGLSKSATDNASDYYKKGPRAGAFVQVQKKLSDEAHARLTKQLNDAYTGVQNAHKVAILEDGAQITENKYTLKDAQVHEARTALVREIAAIYGVPLPLLGVADAKFNDIESLKRFFYSSCLQSYISKIEQRLNLLLPPNMRVRFDTAEYLRGDAKANAEVTRDLLTTGVISVNEARSRVGESPLDNGDVFAIDTNNLTFGRWSDVERLQNEARREARG